MALLLHLHRRATTNAFTITNPSLLRRLFSTGDDQPPSNSNSPFSSYFSDIKQQQPSSPLTPTNTLTSTASQIFFKNLIKCYIAQNPDDSSPPPTTGIGNSDLKTAKPNRGTVSLDAIRESLRQMKADGKDRMSLPAYKDVLKSRPDSSKVFGGTSELPELEEKESHSTVKGVSFMQRMDILNQIGGTPPKEQLVEKYFHPDNMSAAEMLKIALTKVRDEFKMSESDRGSAVFVPTPISYAKPSKPEHQAEPLAPYTISSPDEPEPIPHSQPSDHIEVDPSFDSYPEPTPMNNNPSTPFMFSISSETGTEPVESIPNSPVDVHANQNFATSSAGPSLVNQIDELTASVQEANFKIDAILANQQSLQQQMAAQQAQILRLIGLVLKP